MSGATATSLAELIRPEVAARISDSVFKYSELLPIFQQRGPFGGADYDLKVITAGQSVQVYTEGQALPAPGNQTIITVNAAWKHFRVFFELSGHGRRAANMADELDMASPGLYGNANIELMKAEEDLASKINDTFCDNDIYGVPGICNDDTHNFYDASRATYTTLKSLVLTSGSGAAFAAAIMDKAMAEVRDYPFGGRPQLILMHPTQMRKIADINAGKLATMSADVSASGIGGNGELASWAGVPIKVVPGLVETEIHLLADVDSAWYIAMHEAAPGGLHYRRMGPLSDSQVVQISTSMALICETPNHQATIETLGTT